MTIEQLNQIKDKYHELVMVRKIVKEEGEKLAKNTGYRKQVLICGGTGCLSSNSKEIKEKWMNTEGVNVYLTIDREQEGWDGHVGFVPAYLKEIDFSTDKIGLICGPPIMIKFVLQGMKELGFTDDQVYTTLELRMKCGVGKCGRCNIGSKYVCKDGPVFRFDQIEEMPDEY